MYLRNSVPYGRSGPWLLLLQRCGGADLNTFTVARIFVSYFCVISLNDMVWKTHRSFFHSLIPAWVMLSQNDFFVGNVILTIGLLTKMVFANMSLHILTKEWNKILYIPKEAVGRKLVLWLLAVKISSSFHYLFQSILRYWSFMTFNAIWFLNASC